MAKGRERAALLGRLTGADEAAVWHWGFIQTAATALVLMQIGQSGLARQMLAIAEAWCGAK